MIENFYYDLLSRVYGYDDYTQQEINSKLIQKIDEIINECNNVFEFVEWLKEQGVPDEVKNILNTMLEDGTIENLINVEKLNHMETTINNKIDETKLTIENNIVDVKLQLDNFKKNKIYSFNNVEIMKEYKLFRNGDVCETLGYYSSNDGGGCKYLIEEETKGLGSILLTNGLYANIVYDNDKRVNVLTLGVKRNVKEDQSVLVNEIFQAPTKNIFYFPYGYYYFTNTINQNKRHDIIGDVVTTGDFDTDINGTRFLFENVGDNNTLFDCYNASRCTIKNIYIISNAVKIKENRTIHSTGNTPVDMFTINKSTNYITGLSIGLFGNTIENVTVQGCNVGIHGGTYNTFNKVSFLECETGLRILNDNQINLIRAIRCKVGINITGGLNILTNIRFDSIQEYGITIEYGANYNTITGFVADWCQYGAISINSNNNYINGYIGRCGTYYANLPIGTALEPEKSCLVYLKNCNYNRLDIVNNFESVGDKTSDIVKAPSYQIVMGQGGSNDYNNITLTGKYEFEDPAIELDIDKLKCLVCLNGSYGNTLLNVYGRQYRIKSPNGTYAKENVVVSSLNPLT